MSGLTDEEAETAEIEAKNLIHLLDKYEIELNSEKKWLRLAIAIARDKVKGFSDTLLKYKAIGRPTKKKNSLASIANLGAPKKAQKRGAPRKLKLNPAWIDEIKATHGLSGRGSDKKALEIMAAAYRKPADRRREVEYLQKRLSEARKLARLNSKK